jgi:uncharacterized membrane protein
MATWSAQITTQEASVGRAIGQAVAALAAQPLAAFGTAFALSAGPAAAVEYEFYRVVGGDYGALGRGPAILVLAVAGLLAFGVSQLAQGALVQLAAGHRTGRRVGFGEAVETGLRAMLPMMGRSILATVAIALAAIALLVPAVLLYVVWAVSVPALVLERLGPTDALERSQALTRGARWRVFGFQLLVLALGAILGLAHNALLGESQAEVALVGSVSAAVIASLITAFSAVAESMLYFELRDWKEGPPADRLAEIFG